MSENQQDIAERFRKLMEADDFCEEDILSMDLGKLEREIATRMLMAKTCLDRNSVILLTQGKALCVCDPVEISDILAGLDKVRESLTRELADYVAELKSKHNI